jgi:hypothetical protein
LTDKYSGYDHSIATILRGFDEWVQKEMDRKEDGQPYHSDIFNYGVAEAALKLYKLADQAQREIDECRAAK